jgi:hypothetical protein
MQKEHIKKLYNIIVVHYQTNGGNAGKTNCYTCRDGHITKTIDKDNGVTPFMIRCRHKDCVQHANSSLYRDAVPDLEPTYEWFRPSVEDVIKMDRKGEHGMVDHILNGGLDIRVITK